jgi:hypothetical protein
MYEVLVLVTPRTLANVYLIRRCDKNSDMITYISKTGGSSGAHVCPVMPGTQRM